MNRAADLARPLVRSELYPTFVNQRWRKPRLSLRQQAELKHRLQAMGTTSQQPLSAAARTALKLPADPAVLAFNPEWVRLPRFTLDKPPKGTALERNLEKRVANVDKKLKEVPLKIAEMRAEAAKRKTVTPIEKFLRSKKLIPST